MIIMGIDPGTAKIGFGVLRKIKKIKCLDYGLIQTSSDLPASERLKKINNELNKLIKKYKPDILAVESLYFFKNLKTVIPVSQAIGVILLTAAKKKIPVYEFTPLQIKTALVGYGRASKEQIQKMIKYLLNLKKSFASDDEADALGAAICGILKIENRGG